MIFWYRSGGGFGFELGGGGGCYEVVDEGGEDHVGASVIQ